MKKKRNHNFFTNIAELDGFWEKFVSPMKFLYFMAADSRPKMFF